MTRATIEDLEKRLTALEKTIAELVEHPSSAKPGWRSTVGLFAGDEVMKEIFALGRQIRAAERRDNKT